MNFSFKGIDFEVSDGRLEVCRLQQRFFNLACKEKDKIRPSFEKEFTNLRDFARKGLNWGKQFINIGADLAINELASMDCFDIDRDLWIQKYISYTEWENIVNKAKAVVKQVDSSEAEKESARQQRTESAGNLYSSHKVSYKNGEVRDDLDMGNILTNLTFQAGSGIINMIGRGISQHQGEKKLEALFNSENFKKDIINSIVECITYAYYELVNYCQENNISNNYQLISDEEEDKCQRLINNIKKGNVPEEKIDKCIVEALKCNPLSDEIYRLILNRYGDENNDISALASQFYYERLPIIKSQLVLKKELESDLSSEENTIKAKEQIIKYEQYLGLKADEVKLERIENTLIEFDKKARTVDGYIYETREIAQKHKELSDFANSLRIANEDDLNAKKESINQKAQELGISSENIVDKLEKALLNKNLPANTATGINTNTNQQNVDIKNKKITTAILAFLLGGWGIHQFYLGNKKSGIIRASCSLLGLLIGGIPTAIMWGIAVIETILYIKMPDEEFNQKYIIGKKGWF